MNDYDFSYVDEDDGPEQLTPEQIKDRAIRSLWVYVRQYRDSLDSSRCIERIRHIVDHAVEAFAEAMAKEQFALYVQEHKRQQRRKARKAK